MGVVAEAFRTGGVWMYLILAATMFSWPLALIALITAFVSKRGTAALVVGGLTLLLGLGTMGIGTLGYVIGLSEVEQAIEMASPENRERLRQKGEELASYPLYFGLGSGSVPLALGVVVVAFGMTLRRSRLDGDPS